jgi:hypothetical protein
VATGPTGGARASPSTPLASDRSQKATNDQPRQTQAPLCATDGARCAFRSKGPPLLIRYDGPRGDIRGQRLRKVQQIMVYTVFAVIDLLPIRHYEYAGVRECRGIEHRQLA